VVVGIAFVDALHGFGVSVGALNVVDVIGVRVEDGERMDIVAFTRGRGLGERALARSSAAWVRSALVGRLQSSW
jgi:hypothetical protein